MLDVVIIGGGAAGYSCALTLSSVENTQEWAKDKKYLLIDNNNSDILKASFFNVAGIDVGIGGDGLLKKMQLQLSHFRSCKTLESTVTKLEKNTDGYTVTTTDSSYETKAVVIATGMHKFDIESNLIQVKPHDNVLKSGKICIEHTDNKIEENLYVAGLASGVRTMFAIASGEGAKVACQIFQSWTNQPSVAHDTIKDRLI